MFLHMPFCLPFLDHVSVKHHAMLASRADHSPSGMGASRNGGMIGSNRSVRARMLKCWTWWEVIFRIAFSAAPTDLSSWVAARSCKPLFPAQSVPSGQERHPVLRPGCYPL